MSMSTYLKNLTSNIRENPLSMVGSLLLSFGIGILYQQWSKSNRQNYLKTVRPSRLIVITGCDSGLGFSMAFWAGKLGYKVIAGCLNYESDGAQMLRKEFEPDQMIVVQLDVTNGKSIQQFYEECMNFMNRTSSVQLWAVILNACVGGFGEFFWFTEEQKHRIFDVNFWGAVNVAKSFEPVLLAHKSSLIVVTSDCADFPLPTLSIYSATKAALQTWALSLRHEVAKYGVSVAAFQPGAFPTKSNLFTHQSQIYEEMIKTMSPASLDFYGSYFRIINETYVKIFANKQAPNTLLGDSLIYQTFVSILEDDVVRGRPVVKADEFPAKVYHWLRTYLPVKYGDLFVGKIMDYPVQWKPCEYKISTTKSCRTDLGARTP